MCDPKVGDAEYLRELKEGRTLFGWVHPHVCEEVKTILLRKKFEYMPGKNDGRRDAGIL